MITIFAVILPSYSTTAASTLQTIQHTITELALTAAAPICNDGGKVSAFKQALGAVLNILCFVIYAPAKLFQVLRN
eukprot:UN05284